MKSSISRFSWIAEESGVTFRFEIKWGDTEMSYFFGVLTVTAAAEFEP